MRSRFDGQLEKLNQEMILMGTMVETAIEGACEALHDRDVRKARDIMAADPAVDRQERDIESLCLRMLLMQQPVARDLRLVSSALKMITDMERIGDQAADIAEIVIMLGEGSAVQPPEHIAAMAEEARAMVHSAIDAYVQRDVKLAEKVIDQDDVVDQLFLSVKDELVEQLRKDPASALAGIGHADDRQVFRAHRGPRHQHCRVGAICGHWAVQRRIAGMIYSVEDDAAIRELIVYALRQAGYEAEGFEEGGAFRQALERKTPELVLLDLMLPGEDGLSLLRFLRQNPATRETPVILLTARGTEMDKVVGLDTGADDYVVKPFGVMELLSRVKAVLRRSPKQEAAHVLTAANVTLDPSRRQVTVDGESITLTRKEFDLLETLMRNRGLVMTREKLLDTVWGIDFPGDTRTVDVHMGTLRQKLGAGAALLQTVRGVGYRMED